MIYDLVESYEKHLRSVGIKNGLDVATFFYDHLVSSTFDQKEINSIELFGPSIAFIFGFIGLILLEFLEF